MNLTEKLAQILLTAAQQQFAPNVPEEEAYALLLSEGLSEKEAEEVSDCVAYLAQFIPYSNGDK